jgi:hypothetical protein
MRDGSRDCMKIKGTEAQYREWFGRRKSGIKGKLGTYAPASM